MIGWKKAFFYVCTGIGLLGLVVLVVMQVKEPSQVQAGNDVKTHDQSNKSRPKVKLDGVAGFDLKGITLGDNITTIKEQFSCAGQENFSSGISPAWGGAINCNGARVIFDHNGVVYMVMISKEFSVKPDFQQVLNQVYKKYGKPDLTGFDGNNVASTSSYCWGICKTIVDNQAWISTGKGLKMSYHKRDLKGLYSLYLTLEDVSLGKKESEWEGQSSKREQEKRKARESNLSL